MARGAIPRPGRGALLRTEQQRARRGTIVRPLLPRHRHPPTQRHHRVNARQAHGRSWGPRILAAFGLTTIQMGRGAAARTDPAASATARSRAIFIITAMCRRLRFRRCYPRHHRLHPRHPYRLHRRALRRCLAHVPPRGHGKEVSSTDAPIRVAHPMGLGARAAAEPAAWPQISLG